MFASRTWLHRICRSYSLSVDGGAPVPVPPPFWTSRERDSRQRNARDFTVPGATPSSRAMS